jgi:tetratricopeptide (TPR) repeat protein
MAKKINNLPPAKASNIPQKPVVKPQSAAARKPISPQKTTASGSSSFFLKYANILVPIAIALVTYLFYKVSVDNKFTNWDDLGYITTDPLIKNSSAEGIKRILGFDGILEACVMGNYHPLTILLYTIEYSYYGLQPWIYHLDSVLLHILLTIIVYYFVKVFSHRTVAATVTALLFGLHPMHVESVAWGAGRKDILYGIFFIASIITYIYYIRSSGSKKIVWYISGVILFAISLLAKSVAVTLPITLFLFDYYEKRSLFTYPKPSFDFDKEQGLPDVNKPGKRTLNYMLLIEKLPYFALAYLFGRISIYAQSKIGALGTLDANFNPIERIALGCYALWNYLWKAVIPTGLSNFYPYPLKIGNSLPAYYYIYPAIILGLAFAVWKFARKNKVIIFGLGFFLVNIVLLLQFIPVGGAIMSDRYGYIPYLGFFYIAGWYVSGFFEDKAKRQTGNVVLAITLAYCLALGYLTTQRCKDWYDSISLWKDDAEKHPEAPVAYFYLGQEYFTRYESATNANEKKMDGDSSLYYFNMSVARKPDYINPIICIAELQRNYGLLDDAMQTYYRALKISDKNESVYLGMGVIFSIRRQYDSAAHSFRKALGLKAYFPEGHSNYANFLDITGKVDSALEEYQYAISQNPDAYIPYMNLARIYMAEKKDYDNAIADYSKAIFVKPDNPEPYYLRSKAYFMKGNKAQALQDVEKARAMGYPAIDPKYYQQLK